MLRCAQHDTSGINIRHSTFDIRQSRRGSALVLVMTLLGILFVLGIAFLASMNFEADLIASETQRNRAESRVTAVVDQLGSTLRDGLLSDPRMPFGDPSAALSPTAFAEMPGVQNSFSPIEPHREPGPDGDRVVFSSYTDVAALKHRPFTGPSLPRTFAIDTGLPNGSMVTKLLNGGTAMVCLGGIDRGKPCDRLPGECPGSVCEGPRVLDADGDGIVDSLQVDASRSQGPFPGLGLSDAQLAALSARLNPPTSPTGKVYVGIRVIPHGGLVNLNASHPKLIENVLDVPPLLSDPLADYGYFLHRPTRFQVAYSPLLEESTLRRRELLPPRTMPPSLLHGDPLLDPKKYPNGKADMQWQLFAPLPGGAASGNYETVFPTGHRFSPFNPSHDPADPNAEFYTRANPDLGTLWDVRMEPFSSANADSTMREYDRRHLVTTVSHDDLLARGGRVVNPAVPGGEEDILTKMTQPNQTSPPRDPDACPTWTSSDFASYSQFLGNLGKVPAIDLLPFEYPDYPQSMPNDCCLTDTGCRLNARKGRLQLSLPWLDEQFDAANKLTDPTSRQRAQDRIVRLIHDVFFLLVRNAAHVTMLEGTPCASDADCTYANAVCGPMVPNRGRLCSIAVAPPALPKAFDDCATGCSIPGSVCHKYRNDPYYRMCTIQAPYWQDRPCTTNADCASGEFCDVPPGMTTRACMDVWTHQTHSQALISRTAASLTANLIDYADADDIPARIALRSFDFTRGVCAKGTAGLACDKDTDCGAGGVCSLGANSAGREFNFVPAPNKQFQYVYGLERQPYITEVATYSEATTGIAARAVELFNPYPDPIDGNTQYLLREINPGASAPNDIPLNVGPRPNIGVNPQPFTVFVTASDAASRTAILLGSPTSLRAYDLTGAGELKFTNGSVIYLLRSYTYPGDLNVTYIVVDQFEVPLNGKVGNADPDVPVGTYSRQRMVLANSPWTATVPKTGEIGPGPGTLGDWNTFAPTPPPHPVEVNFADLGSFTRPVKNPPPNADPRAFPTTGSLLMLMRHANRSFPAPGEPIVVKELAFTTHLIGDTVFKNPVGGAPIATISAEQQIDNGRMPVFDPPVLGTDGNWYAAHHLSASTTHVGAPGNLDTLPWGQLVFDYFTALPLSNPGPYVDVEPGPEVVVALPDSKPRVDLDGLRVHGRININAAPWKVLAGLPFVPVEKIPIPFRDRMRSMLPGDPSTGQTYAQLFPDDQAGTIGNPLAQAIVAYRELRPVGGSGNYADGIPLAGTPPSIAYARGWDATPPVAPMARRGTGFMTVGELANVRHLGITNPLYRIDSGVIDVDPADNNTENFVDAAAALVALGDWVTVRSQVFTVYGVLRGEDDSTIVDPIPAKQQQLRTQDVDSRALRFQETIDRLPTFLGEPMPSRIGGRTLTRYTDAHND